MAERENIVAGLQEAAAYFRSSFDAMYGTAACEKFRSWTDAIEQALTLLKAQEPRVMTLGQVRDEADHMYLEKHSKTGSDLYGCAIRGDWDVYGIELLMSEYDTARERWRDYGKTWRCWTSRPTDEQMEATPWN